MKFIADLHIHSKFSIATAKNLDFENTYIAAQLKGITVIGTGDFTHPGWFSEIKEKLVPAEPGLFKLKNDIAKICDKEVPALCRAKVRFILVTEISNIYKKAGKVRKNHNLVFFPEMETAEKFNSKLDKIGNIKSDGRPILGLDAKNLLEIALETSDKAFLIPAHIWTPWFSILGSKSGFDSLEECFEDLTPNIFAVETGLSSDPPMNRRVSGLDGLTLVSNSDAHSPMKLGREANLFDTDLSYYAIRSAIKKGDGFLGTFEFYPEEGKYHLDGHRKCNIRFRPEETIKNKGICPICKKPLTLGVLYRVEELADRPENVKPEKKLSFFSIIPLTEILSEILKVGSGSKRVKQKYRDLLDRFGSEFKILHTLKPESLESAGTPLLSEAIRRMRNKEITLLPGYDGEFGTIKIFTKEERKKFSGQKSLFVIEPSEKILNKNWEVKEESKKRVDSNSVKPARLKPRRVKQNEKENDITGSLNRDQRNAVLHENGPLMIIAGPGTGKTRTLTHRIAYLAKEKGVSPENILAVTFTNKAALEMRGRLEVLMKNFRSLPFIATFHSLCFQILKEQEDKFEFTVIEDDDRKALMVEAIKEVERKGMNIKAKPQVFLDKIVFAKQQVLGPDDNLEATAGEINKKTFTAVYHSYQNLLLIHKCYDFEDLISKVVLLFRDNETIRQKYKEKFKFIFIDEYQDLNHGQFRIIQAMAPSKSSNNNLCVIGDPDQSVYGFRGSDVRFFNRFKTDYPDAKIITLSRNYRSTQTILEASYQVIQDSSSNTGSFNSSRDNHYSSLLHDLGKPEISQPRVYSQINGFKTIVVLELSTERAEAEAIGHAIEQMIGGTGHHSIDTGRIKDFDYKKERSFSDFAVFYRTRSQSRTIADVFDKTGIPNQVVSKEKAFNTKGIKELLSLLKVVEGVGSYMDFKRIISLTRPGISRQTADIFKSWSYKNSFSLDNALYHCSRFPIPGMSKQLRINFHAFIDSILRFKKEINGMSVEKKLQHFKENTQLGSTLKRNPESTDTFNRLIDISKQHGNETTGFFATIALQTDTDIYSSQAEKVTLMTMHAAKGLEFPVVFIAGCEKGYIPFQRNEETDIDINEERRLFFVAMTRAKERLYLTRAEKRRIFGKTVARELSPIVEDIENRLRKHEAPTSKKKKKKSQVQLELFS